MVRFLLDKGELSAEWATSRFPPVVKVGGSGREGQGSTGHHLGSAAGSSTRSAAFREVIESGISRGRPRGFDPLPRGPGSRGHYSLLATVLQPHALWFHRRFRADEWLLYE
ncbi:MAG: hypothetical protein EA351_00435, partial [Gemmatimonadales bacterium]